MDYGPHFYSPSQTSGPCDPIPASFSPPAVSIELEVAVASPQLMLRTTRALLLDVFNACGLPDVNPINADGSLNEDEGQQSALLGWQELANIPRRAR
jgi:hypothetical protein